LKILSYRGGVETPKTRKQAISEERKIKLGYSYNVFLT
jgi:hypothetical protein